MMTTAWRRGKRIASAMGMTSVYQYLHIISITNNRVIVLDHHSQLVVMKLLILPMIPLAL
jgi:hypothetical protein